MNTKKKVLSIGVLLLAGGVITSLVSHDPTKLLRYMFVAITAVVGVLALMVGHDAKRDFVRSKYYTWIGLILILLTLSLGFWATTLPHFISILGFFLILLGILEFVFAQQLLVYEEPLPWAVVGIKLFVSTVSAVGGAWILTMADRNVNVAILFLGVLFVFVGLAFVQLGRMVNTTTSAVSGIR